MTTPKNRKPQGVCSVCGKKTLRTRTRCEDHAVGPGRPKGSTTRPAETSLPLEQEAPTWEQLEADAAEVPDWAETVPAEPARPSLVRRVFSRGGGTGDKGAAPPPSRERRPRPPVKARVSTKKVASGLFAMVGGWVEAADVGVGRALKLSAPAAGQIVDRQRGTLLDRALQPLARAEDDYMGLVMLVFGPMMIGAVERGVVPPQTAVPVLRDYVRALGPDSIKALRETKKDDADLAEALEGLGAVVGLEGVITVDYIVAWLLEGLGAVYEPDEIIPAEAVPA